VCVILLLLHFASSSEEIWCYYLDAKTTAPGWPVPLLPKGKTTRENPGVMPYSQKDEADKSSGAVKVPKGKSHSIDKSVLKGRQVRLLA
jgi:hypothetical protein